MLCVMSELRIPKFMLIAEGVDCAAGASVRQLQTAEFHSHCCDPTRNFHQNIESDSGSHKNCILTGLVHENMKSGVTSERITTQLCATGKCAKFRPRERCSPWSTGHLMFEHSVHLPFVNAQTACGPTPPEQTTRGKVPLFWVMNSDVGSWSWRMAFPPGVFFT